MVMVSGISLEEQRLQKERVRVYALARELDVESKDLLDLCKQAGFDVKNQLSNLEPEQVTMLKDLVKRGTKGPGAPAPAKPVIPVHKPEVGKAIPNLTTRVRREPEAPRTPAETPAAHPEKADTAHRPRSARRAAPHAAPDEARGQEGRGTPATDRPPHCRPACRQQADSPRRRHAASRGAGRRRRGSRR